MPKRLFPPLLRKVLFEAKKRTTIEEYQEVI